MHAGVVVAHDRAALERLCRYGARPAFAQERLAWTADGRIAYKLKRPWPDGRTHLVMEPVAFLRRLCGIIPPPRRHLVRYSGIFGPASKHRHALRALVLTDHSHEAGDARCTEPRPSHTAGPASRVRQLPWADLLRRVFVDDVPQCPCGGRRSVVAIVTDSALARVLLAEFGLATEPSTFAPARAPPQADLPFEPRGPTRHTRPVLAETAARETPLKLPRRERAAHALPETTTSPRTRSDHPGRQALDRAASARFRCRPGRFRFPPPPQISLVILASCGDCNEL